VSEDQALFGVACSDGIKMPGESAFDGCLRNKGGACVQKYRQALFGGVLPEAVPCGIVGAETGVHGQQLHAFQTQHLMSVDQFVHPAGLSQIDGEKTDELLRMCGDVGSDGGVVDPESAEPSLTAEDDRSSLGRGRRAVVFETHCQVHFNARTSPPRLLAEGFIKVRGYSQKWLWTSMIMWLSRIRSVKAWKLTQGGGMSVPESGLKCKFEPSGRRTGPPHCLPFDISSATSRCQHCRSHRFSTPRSACAFLALLP
jgi:hypothetical protein